MSTLLLFLLSFFLCCFQEDSLADTDNKPLLELGMSYIDVIRLWGPAQEKMEREAKREELWIYSKECSVLFREGVVSAFQNRVGDKEQLPLIKTANRQDQSNRNKSVAYSGAKKNFNASEILGEVMKLSEHENKSHAGKPMAPNLSTTLLGVDPLLGQGNLIDQASKQIIPPINIPDIPGLIPQ
ncbi:MAG TPA: hypothetical protein PKD37_03165 [Oligoflexia bacterium]|nr:hypothetical protein [Oligoflexia bacterium]HMP26968.1 hypothetical protein [Oligoflexia bacterium]